MQKNNFEVYFLTTNGNNVVVITNHNTAKIFDCTPSGKFDGIDLYEDPREVANKLNEHFMGIAETMEEAGSTYEDFYCENEVPFDEIKHELFSEKAILVY